MKGMASQNANNYYYCVYHYRVHKLRYPPTDVKYDTAEEDGTNIFGK